MVSFKNMSPKTFPKSSYFIVIPRDRYIRVYITPVKLSVLVISEWDSWYSQIVWYYMVGTSDEWIDAWRLFRFLFIFYSFSYMPLAFPAGSMGAAVFCLHWDIAQQSKMYWYVVQAKITKHASAGTTKC